MTEIHKTAVLNATAERLFAFLIDPQNISKYVPNVERVFGFTGGEQMVGDSFRVRDKRLGITFDELFTLTLSAVPPKNTPHRRFAIGRSFDGPLQGSLRWTLEALDNETEVGLDLEYRLVGGLVGRAFDVLVLRRINQSRIAHLLENLKLAMALPAASRT